MTEQNNGNGITGIAATEFVDTEQNPDTTAVAGHVTDHRAFDNTQVDFTENRTQGPATGAPLGFMDTNLLPEVTDNNPAITGTAATGGTVKTGVEAMIPSTQTSVVSGDGGVEPAPVATLTEKDIQNIIASTITQHEAAKAALGAETSPNLITSEPAQQAVGSQVAETAAFIRNIVPKSPQDIIAEKGPAAAKATHVGTQKTRTETSSTTVMNR